MQGDDPPFLPVGTDVSAKYKGAFCEAKIKKVVRNIKCKVTLKAGGGTITVNDDVIKGTLRVGSTVEVKQDPKKDAMEAVITKIQDCSQYTVVFDDGDITTLRRSALCLKSGRHFNESETLDQLPLTHPEHFSTPVIAGRRGRRGRAQSDESESENSSLRGKADSAEREREPHVGRVVLVEAAGGAERRRPHQPAFPALVVAPTPQIKVKEDYLVRSFKDGRYYTVPKKEAREFRKGSAPLEWAGVEAALQYLNNSVLPPHWDRDTLFNEPRNSSDDSSDDEPREEKDHFVAQLYKFMDDRGTPLNRNPTIAKEDIDLYRLFMAVQKLGGYNRVTNQNQWKTIADKMGFHPVTTSITNLCKQAYKKFLHSFEDFYRKLGVTLVAHPRGARTPPAGRSLIRDKDRLPPASSTSASTSSTPTSTQTATQRGKEKDSDKSETDKSEKSEKDEKEKVEKVEVKSKEKPRTSDGEDSADNQPLAAAAPKVEKEKEKEKEKDKERDKSTSTTTSEEKISIKPRSQSKGRTNTPAKAETHDKKIVKRRPLSSKSESATTSTPRASRRPNASTDSDSSGRASRCGGPTKKMQSRRSQSANSASSGNTIASNSSKRPRKRKNTEPSTSEPTRSTAGNVKAQVGDKLEVYYGPTQSESKVTYEAKVIEISAEGMLRVHYTGWNTRYDEWIKPQRIAVNVSQQEARNKKNPGISRRVRAKRTEESSARSDSDSDTDSDELVKRPPTKLDEKSNSKTPTRTKDNKSSDSSSSSKPRKRPIRNVSTPTSVSPTKKPRANVTSHQGRDYDLNEIRSELKGLHSVKQEPEESIKQEPMDADPNPPPKPQVSQVPPEPPRPEKQAEDVYEFKEPEPFEIELHDEKKKRTHRIFDDISPSKYSSTLSKSLSEEILEDPLRSRPSLRSPSLSPFRDFSINRDTNRQSPEDDSKDGLFSLDDDSFPGDGSSCPTFEGFTPAKNQETYSKKSKVSKLRELINDSPDSPADDEQSSDDEHEDMLKDEDDDEEVKDPDPPSKNTELEKVPESEIKEPPKEDNEAKSETDPIIDKEKIIEEKLKPIEELKEIVKIEKSKTPPPQKKVETPIIKKLEVAPQKKTETSTQKKTEISTQKKTEISTQKKTETSTQKKTEISAQKKTEISTQKKTEITTQKKAETKQEKKNETQAQKKIESFTSNVVETPSQKKLEIQTQNKETPPQNIVDTQEQHSRIDVTLQINIENPTQKKAEVVTQKKVEALSSKKVEPSSQKKIEFIPQKNVEVSTPKKIETPKVLSPAAAVSTTTIKAVLPDTKVKEEIKEEDTLKSSNLPTLDVKEKSLTLKIDKKMDTDPVVSKLEPPSSPLIDTEEDKSEPDSPARIDVIPEPPPGFLLQSEGPKIAEKLLKAISSAKQLSISPPPTEDRPNTPKVDTLKLNRPESKLASISPELRLLPPKTELVKPVIKIDPVKKGPSDAFDSIFGEPSNITDAKRDPLDIRKVRPCEATPPRLQSPLNILERRKSVAELPLVPGKNNKVLSDTIQKLSSQINQAAAAVATPIPIVPPVTLPAFPAEDRSDSSDSDDSDRRLIIDKLSMEEWSSGVMEPPRSLAASVGAALAASARGIHAGKSPGEWSAGESLLMLEDACKNERKHSASVVVAGSGRVASAVGPSAPCAVGVATGEEDSNLSLLLCEETIPGSPAPDAAEPAPPKQRLHMPFASAPPHHTHSKGEGASRNASGSGSAAGTGGAAEGPGGVQAAPSGGTGWGRRQPVPENTPPTTPDSSLDMSPHRERRLSERDSPSERKEDDDDGRNHDPSAMDLDKPTVGLRSRKASESSGAGRGRARRTRRDTDDVHQPPRNSPTTLKYNFYVELDPTWDCQTRINVLTTRLADLRKTYHSVKAELAAIDRRRKKLRRKEREAVKAAKAACS